MMNLIYTYQPLFDYFLLAVGFAAQLVNEIFDEP